MSSQEHKAPKATDDLHKHTNGSSSSTTSTTTSTTSSRPSGPLDNASTPVTKKPKSTEEEAAAAAAAAASSEQDLPSTPSYEERIKQGEVCGPARPNTLPPPAVTDFSASTTSTPTSSTSSPAQAKISLTIAKPGYQKPHVPPSRDIKLSRPTGSSFVPPRPAASSPKHTPVRILAPTDPGYTPKSSSTSTSTSTSNSTSTSTSLSSVLNGHPLSSKPPFKPHQLGPSVAQKTPSSPSTSAEPMSKKERRASQGEAKNTLLSKFLDDETIDESLPEYLTASLDATAGQKRGAAEGFCVECEERECTKYCVECDDFYCDMCFISQHRKGKRAVHTAKSREEGLRLVGATTATPAPEATAEPAPTPASASAASDAAATTDAPDTTPATPSKDQPFATHGGWTVGESSTDPDAPKDAPAPAAPAAPAPAPAPPAPATQSKSSSASSTSSSDSEEEGSDGNSSAKGKSAPATPSVPKPVKVSLEYERYTPEWFVERAKYIPVRLTLPERKHLRLLEAALSVSEYTTIIDSPAHSSAAKRLHASLQQICSLLSGIAVASNYEVGQELISSRDFEEHAKFYSKMFELARRHKIMNPEKMRSTYGKLVCLLQDSMSEEAQALLNFKTVTKVVSVHQYLASRGCEGVLREPDLKTATMEILPEGKTRNEIQREIEAKEKAQERIARKYGPGGPGVSRDYKGNAPLTKDNIKWALYSMSDNNSFLRCNRDPIDDLIVFLKKFFKPDSVEEGFSLAITSGESGARLTHDHARQYNYVLQSLTLWREILDDFFRLWTLAEEDLLAEHNTYKLTDTGQGLQRVQQSNRILSAMRQILHKTQTQLGSWVGSSVIHLGDHNVPNALTFIDKYTQVSRILTPIVSTLKKIPKLCENPHIRQYVDDKFGSPELLQKQICKDFFLRAFDGSGADNFYDAGSCIDGRLTSAWNWCSKLADKPFYHIFKLTGFTSFDGEFQD